MAAQKKLLGNKTRIVKGWDSNWYGGEKFTAKLVEDQKIRNLVRSKFSGVGVSRIIIERTLERLITNIFISSSDPVFDQEMIVIDELQEQIKDLTGREVEIKTIEIQNPELDAAIVGQRIAKKIKSGTIYQNVISETMLLTMDSGAQGIKVKITGNLDKGGPPRSESFKKGRIPLQTLRADIDYSIQEFDTEYGKIRIKVWISRNQPTETIRDKVKISEEKEYTRQIARLNSLPKDDQYIHYSICDDFSDKPDGMTIESGDYSGEHLRKDIDKLIELAATEEKKIKIYFDGGSGYSLDFLYGAFSSFPDDKFDYLKIVSTEQPALIDLIEKFAKE